MTKQTIAYQCPRCKDLRYTTKEDWDAHPDRHCGNCLMEAVEIVSFVRKPELDKC